MAREASGPGQPVPAAAYTEEYYRSGCGGGEAFESGSGLTVSPVVEQAFDSFGVGPGRACLDLGCGRGEVTFNLAKRGASAIGIDYADSALRLAQGMLERHPDIKSRVLLVKSDAKALPFPDASIDCAFVLDLVEHLQPWELGQSLSELHRVMKPDGMVLVHTMPNLRYYRFAYPALRLIGRMQRHESPAEPRGPYEFDLHVNEQTPGSLRTAMRVAGFLVEMSVTGLEKSPLRPGLLDRFVRVLAKHGPLRSVLGFHILVTARPATSQLGPTPASR